MVYHVPYPLSENATSASAIRPVKMLRTFEELGYEVTVISGYAKERKEKIQELYRRLRSGLKVDFVYSESATIPMSFTEPKHFPLHLNLDRKFFAEMHRHHVPVGVFYRDIYWVFPEYDAKAGKLVAVAMRQLYRQEIETYNRYVDVVFLPSLEYGKHIPNLNGPQTVTLPPGAPIEKLRDNRVVPAVYSQAVPLSLLYAGGIGDDHYRMEKLFEAVKNNPCIKATFCVPAQAWERNKADYQPFLAGNLEIVHRSSAELEELYDQADVGLLVVEPGKYREFAVPFKLYDYLGHGKPIISNNGVYAAQIIEQYDAGWTVSYDANSLGSLLAELVQNPQMVARKTANAVTAATEESWQNRAQKVAQVLNEVKGM